MGERRAPPKLFSTGWSGGGFAPSRGLETLDQHDAGLWIGPGRFLSDFRAVRTLFFMVDEPGGDLF
ncbi:MAG: hypothetical protein A2W03_05895 [Candidatus Aminicenantes bacterium RBG_16_63_16]|nr:MAG: hypothetical protein A2W03_05895 [Candidatus Aminicenantes bacterium RBG_16_63_16]